MKTLKEMIKGNKNLGKEDVLAEDKAELGEMDKDTIPFENIEDEDSKWTILLFMLILLQEHENEKLWKDFKEEIKYKSRFFPKSELFNKIDDISEYASVELSKGTILYRAREYKDADYLKNEEVIAMYEKLNEFFPHFELQLEDIRSESAMTIITLALSGDIDKIEELRQKLEEIINREKPFWGFDEKNCDAPPKEDAKAGRANSVGISFLYVATDVKTAIMEMRPQIGQCFNVCKIEILKNLKIFDFTYVAAEIKEDEYIKSGDLHSLSKEFSYPNYGDVEDYIPTQYLCEYLREQGFDGIRYKSAVSSEGVNLIIFNTDKEDRAYRIIESRVYNIKNMNIEYEQEFPIKFEGID